ncbi:hypothetical protein BDB00DRAFT_943430 [Zychaea mexicana]|uniref:uncharacterized protein n=1 Tax=Zychaea mexicana TaxID=64656 RepID=UPI0022FF1D9E|nr:uncharacterized protein BDB00DRAFT_943430 [Zychaea mexicana]KAI9479509.1 hypothetical protein BDB00DRAFT_943430 [Zychaea mexicana]
MKARVHVDYLSHDWEASDAICAHTQIHKQIRAMSSKLGNDPDNKSLRLEHQRLSRYQNALWRQMARICTSRLGKHNHLVHPSTVNWQKESDITWLYGPLYADEHDQAEMVTTTSTPTSTAATDVSLHHQTEQQQHDHLHDGLKPVLKSSIYVRRRREQDSICSSSSSSATADERIPSFSSIASTSSSVSIPPPATPTHSNFVRFSPESTKIQYFIPESPVREFLGGDEGWNPYWSYEDDEDDDQEDDDLWELMHR